MKRAASLPERVVAVLDSVIGKPAALHEPEIGEAEWASVRDALESGWVSSAGPAIGRFEAALADYTGTPHAVATVNGTAALHACLLLIGTQQGDEVIVPSLTFVATANAVAYCGAVPHFADVDEATLGLDPARLDRHLGEMGERRGGALVNRRTGRTIRAVVCMHTFGFPCDADALAEVCAHHGVPLIEDAAESLGTFHRGRHTGTRGRLAALSFNGNKIVTTGGGGAILTHDPALAREARHLTTTAKTAHPWRFDHDRVGFNYRLPNLNAALGVAQLGRIEDFVRRKRALAARYAAAFAGEPEATLYAEAAETRANQWLNVLLLGRAAPETRAPERGATEARDAVLAAAHAAGYGCRPAWTPMHRLPMFAACPRMDLAATEDLVARIVNLPSSAGLGGSG